MHKLNVRSSTLSDLKKVDVGIWKGDQFKGTTIPTLQEVLKIIPLKEKELHRIKRRS